MSGLHKNFSYVIQSTSLDKIMQAIIIPNINTAPIPFASNKHGQGVVIVSQKELGKRTGLKGSALKKAHFAYRCEAGRAMNAELSARMAQGDILSRKMVPTKNGELSVVFTPSSMLTAPTDKPTKLAQENAALKAEIEALKAAMANK